MKKLTFFEKIFIIISFTIISSCGNQKENKVREFAFKFGDFVNMNLKDSIKYYYPNFQLTDSLSNLAVSNVLVSNSNSENIYIVEYSPEKFITIKFEPDNKFSILESKGLLAFNNETIQLVKDKNLWNENLNDITLRDIIIEQARIDSIQKAEEMNNFPDITFFCKKKNYDIDGTIVNSMSILPFSQITQNLVDKLGFQLIDINSRLSDEIQGEYYNIKNYFFERDKYGYKIKIEVSDFDNNVLIKFPDEKLVEKFVESALNNQFTRKNNNLYTFYRKWHQPAYEGNWDVGVGIKISGNNIKLFTAYPPFD